MYIINFTAIIHNLLVSTYLVAFCTLAWTEVSYYLS